MTEPSFPTSREDILPPPQAPFRGSIGTDYRQSTPDWPDEPSAPDGAPNVVVILLDDLGFGHTGCYGGQIRTPSVDRLAAQGLRYNHFHTTGLCSPSRAALLTGRNHHSVGFSVISEIATGYPGANSFLPRSAATLAEVLRLHGYNTMCVGKWHLAPAHHSSPAGPFDRWPLGLGFERFYGFLPGETDHWHPMLTEDNRRIPKPEREGYHLSEDLVDQAIVMLRNQQQVATGRPFFLYLAFGAPHCPFHVAPEWIERYRGRFDAGWDAAREEIFERQKALAIVPADAVLPERNPGVEAWDSLSADERRLYARLMETFAGFVEHTDAQIGRVLAELDRLGVADDTIVMFMSDNGASQEGGSRGTLNTETFRNLVQLTVPQMLAQYDQIGGPDTDPHYPKGWGMAGNTPFKRWKRDTHRGGNADPFIVRWPARIRDGGAIRPHYHHLTDVMPTLLEVIGLPVPRVVNGVPQMPLAGVSMAASWFDAAAPRAKQVQHYEMLGSRAIWADGWTAVTWHASGSEWDDEAWELYHSDRDFTQAHDLASQYPEKLRELQELWWQLAREHQVLPLDDRLRNRIQGTRRPRAYRDGMRFRYWPGTAPVPSGCRPALINRHHRIEARLSVGAAGGHGVLLAVGSAINGFVLFLDQGRLHFVSNAIKLHYSTLAAERPMQAGPHRVAFEFTPTGRGEGIGRLSIDGVEVAGPAEVRTAPLVTSFANEGLCVGRCWSSSPAPHMAAAAMPFDGELDEIEIVPGELLPIRMQAAAAEG